MPGVTESEAHLTRLARNTFFHLWSYSNLFNDKNRRDARGQGQELCDLLVVFGSDVLIFSDKDCELNTAPNLEFAWRRWHKAAVCKSARQAAGAERWIRNFPNRI